VVDCQGISTGGLHWTHLLLEVLASFAKPNTQIILSKRRMGPLSEAGIQVGFRERLRGSTCVFHSLCDEPCKVVPKPAVVFEVVSQPPEVSGNIAGGDGIIPIRVEIDRLLKPTGDTG